MFKTVLIAASLLLFPVRGAPLERSNPWGDRSVFIKLTPKTISRDRSGGKVLGPDTLELPGFNNMVKASPFGLYVDRDYYGPYFQCYIQNNTRVDENVKFTIKMEGKEAVIKCDDEDLDVEAECELDREGTSSTVFFTNKAGETKLTKTGLWMDVRPTKHEVKSYSDA